MLLGDYGSDSGSESDNEAGPSVQAPKAEAPAASAKAKPIPAEAPGFAASRGKKRGGPVRITLDLPKASSSKAGAGDEDEDGDSPRAGRADRDDDDNDEDGPDAKRAKTGAGGIKGGKGSSMLLGMLPPPKRKLPIAGGSKPSLAVNKSMATSSAAPLASTKADDLDMDDGDEAGIPGQSASGMMLPPSLGRAKGKAAAPTSKKDEDDGLDLFGLGSASSASASTLPPASRSSTSTGIKPPTITSAPSVADYVPPPPTPSDPYPGYYQLPSGSWAAYDPAYYASFFTDADANAARQGGDVAQPKSARGEDGRVGHHWDAFEGREGDVVDVYASAGLEEARAAEERKKSMIKPKLAGDEFDYKPVGQIKGLASDRHQLSSLLNTAYTQREALEERIAQNKRSARMGKSKYGF